MFAGIIYIYINLAQCHYWLCETTQLYNIYSLKRVRHLKWIARHGEAAKPQAKCAGRWWQSPAQPQKTGYQHIDHWSRTAKAPGGRCGFRIAFQVEGCTSNIRVSYIMFPTQVCTFTMGMWWHPAHFMNKCIATRASLLVTRASLLVARRY